MARRVLFQLSGSIAAYKACHVVSQLVQAGCEVHAVATPGALQFVGPATLEGLTGRPVATDTFEPGRAMEHIHLVRWADVIVLCPASANTLNRLASGIADDLVGTMFLAHDFTKRYVAVPAMNATTYGHPATARSLATLRGWGVEVIEPAAGALACGETGTGRLAEPETIAARILALTATPPASRRLRVAVTSGGTKVPIDGVRGLVGDETVLVAFKLTSGADVEARRKAVASVSACADLVVHNDVAGGLAPQHHPATLYRGDDVLATVGDNEALAAALEGALLEAVTG